VEGTFRHVRSGGGVFGEKMASCESLSRKMRR